MSWDEAKEWAKGLEIDLSGWHMPKRKKLGTLYQEGKGKRNMTRLLDNEAWWIWPVGPDDRFLSSLFDFSHGTRYWYSRTPMAYAVHVRK